jgi:triacylglycerol lipase
MRSDHRPNEVRWAIVREGLAFAAHGLLYPFNRPRRVPSPRRPDLRTVVFVHGLAANSSGFLPLQAYLRMRGHRRQYAFNYRSRGSIERHALALKREIDEHVRGGRIDIVAHSLGGLVARFYLQQLAGDRRVDRLITLGTPHHGTHAANFIPSGFVRQLLPSGPFVQHLNALPPPREVHTTSLIAGRDLLIQPIEAAQCPFGDVRDYPELGHVELLFRPEVFREVARRLKAKREEKEEL